MKSWWQILPQHQSTYVRGSESASIDIPLSNLIIENFQKNTFQLIQILDLLDMNFNSVVVFVINSSLLFRLAMAMLWSVKVIFIQGEVFLHQLCQNMAADCSLSKIKRAHHNFALKIELCSFFLWFQNNWCRKCVNLMNNLYWYFSLTVKE